MSGASTTTHRPPEKTWEVTGADGGDLAGELAAQGLPKRPVEAIEVSSIVQVGEALDRLQRNPGVEVVLHFAPSCPGEVFDFAFNLPKSISEAIGRYNEILAQAGRDPTSPSYGLTPATLPQRIVLSIDPTLGANASLSKTAMVDLSSVDQSSASEATRDLAALLERAYACRDNPPRLEVEMPVDPIAAALVQAEILVALHKPESTPEAENRRLVYMRKRLELLDLILDSMRMPATALIDWS